MFIIAIDGLDGTGKSSLAHSLKGYIQDEHKQKAIVSSDLKPLVGSNRGFDDFGPTLRELLMKRPSNYAELFLILAARAQHLSEVILPAIAEDYVVILDRYQFSTIAHQGAGAGLPFAYIDMISTPLMFATPALQIILEAPWRDCLTRKAKFAGENGKKLDSFESRDYQYWERVGNWFNHVARSHREGNKLEEAPWRSRGIDVSENGNDQEAALRIAQGYVDEVFRDRQIAEVVPELKDENGERCPSCTRFLNPDRFCSNCISIPPAVKKGPE